MGIPVEIQFNPDPNNKLMKFTFLGNLIQYGPIKLNDSPVQLCESQNTFRCYFRQASQFS